MTKGKRLASRVAWSLLAGLGLTLLWQPLALAGALLVLVAVSEEM